MDTRTKFEMGRLFITVGAQGVLRTEDVMAGIVRHARGDWGELCPEDAARNELALVKGLRLLSAHRSRSGATFWLITEADRSCTTVLLPEDY